MNKKQIREQLESGSPITVSNDDEREMVLNAFGIPSDRQKRRIRNFFSVGCVLAALFFVAKAIQDGKLEQLLLPLRTVWEMFCQDPVQLLEPMCFVIILIGSVAYIINNLFK